MLSSSPNQLYSHFRKCGGNCFVFDWSTCQRMQTVFKKSYEKWIRLVELFEYHVFIPDESTQNVPFPSSSFASQQTISKRKSSNLTYISHISSKCVMLIRTPYSAHILWIELVSPLHFYIMQGRKDNSSLFQASSRIHKDPETINHSCLHDTKRIFQIAQVFKSQNEILESNWTHIVRQRYLQEKFLR